MELKYDASLPYQQAAMEAVCGLFEGHSLAESSLAITSNVGMLTVTELGIGNQHELDADAILANLHRVQTANGIAKAPGLDGLDFAVEMETGTGKTYVYLRTAFELNKRYGFKKFVIVVPSVPIREGVLHSIETMREHFRALYGTPFDHFVYSGRQLTQLRSFATSNTMQLMVINIQAFQRDVKSAGDADAGTKGSANVIYRDYDTLNGWRPIDYLQATKPIVILDEPQKLAGDASVAAIGRLDPLCTLRYSATYDHPNKIYRLGPIEAFEQKLVKRIEVASVTEEANLNQAYIRLLKTDGAKQTAQVEINVGSGVEVKRKKVTIRGRDDLQVKSNDRQEYQDNYIVQNISFEKGNESIAFTNGHLVTLGQELGGLREEVMRRQVHETVVEHVEKEKRLRPLGIKVLSLFFIDKVANYRLYNDDGTEALGKIGQWFEAAYNELAAKPAYAGVLTDPVARVHDGYFSVDRQKRFKDTSGETKDDDSTYELIMRDKERLLSLDEPLRFIFSHSALREGWDNPNVFQICTLNETRSVVRKRQEIGRGLRLPVNQSGERVHDPHINRLTVVANESYRDFAAQLQAEYEQEAGLRFGKVPADAFAGLMVARDGQEPEPLGQAGSRELWRQLAGRGYLDLSGTIQPKFRPNAPGFALEVSDEYAELRPRITDAMSAYVFSNHVADARRKERVRVRKQLDLDPNFRELWDKVAQKTRYRVTFDTEDLVKRAASRIQLSERIAPLSIETTVSNVDPTYAGVESGRIRRHGWSDVTLEHQIPDVLAYLQNETDLTRHTLARILIVSGRCEEIRVNPQAFITQAAAAIRHVLQELMLNGIEYERVAGQIWEMHWLEDDAEQELKRYLDNLYKVQHETKTTADYIEYQSDVERRFAEALDNSDQVKFFVKLPAWFKIATPLGPYNPDWAILLTRETEKLYLVQETKGSTRSSDLRETERRKIACGRKHFKALGVRYDVTTSLTETLRRLSSSSARL